MRIVSRFTLDLLGNVKDSPPDASNFLIKAPRWLLQLDFMVPPASSPKYFEIRVSPRGERTGMNRGFKVGCKFLDPESWLRLLMESTS